MAQPSESEIQRIMREMEEQRQTAGVSARDQLRETVLPALRAAGITHVTAEYDGQGDSGQIERITFLRGEDKAEQSLADTLHPQIEDALYAMLEMRYAGWEINEGSYGEFVWEIATDELHLTHNQRIESVETYEEEL